MGNDGQMDGNETVAERCGYDAYGGCAVLDADGSADSDGLSDVGNAYAFTGRRLDLESNLMQYRHRYHSPTLGRFISRDPLEYSDGYALYAYAWLSPTMGLDAMGLARHCVGWDKSIHSIIHWPGRRSAWISAAICCDAGADGCTCSGQDVFLVLANSWGFGHVEWSFVKAPHTITMADEDCTDHDCKKECKQMSLKWELSHAVDPWGGVPIRKWSGTVNLLVCSDGEKGVTE